MRKKTRKILSNSARGDLVSSWSNPGALLGRSRGALGHSLGAVGHPCGVLGRSWGVVGREERPMGAQGEIIEAPGEKDGVGRRIGRAPLLRLKSSLLRLFSS